VVNVGTIPAVSSPASTKLGGGNPDPYTEHPTREGKVYCSVVLDVFSRRVVGWSIDSALLWSHQETRGGSENCVGARDESVLGQDRDPESGNLQLRERTREQKGLYALRASNFEAVSESATRLCRDGQRATPPQSGTSSRRDD
jgi:hypothetical protein